MVPLIPILAGVLILSSVKPNEPQKGTSGYGTMSQQDMQMVQHDLQWLGYYFGPMHGRFDADTSRAVRSFQDDHGIDPADGLPGPETRKLLDSAVAGSC